MSEVAAAPSGQRIRMVEEEDALPATGQLQEQSRAAPGDLPAIGKGLVLVERETLPEPARSRRRLSARKLGLAGAALVVGLGAAWYGHSWWTLGRFTESTDDAYVGGEITVVAPKVSGFIAEVVVTDKCSNLKTL